MKPYFRQSMAWLHTWTGLLAGWAMFFVFVTGTAAFFSDEVTRWMQPELPLRVERQSISADGGDGAGWRNFSGFACFSYFPLDQRRFENLLLRISANKVQAPDTSSACRFAAAV
jgi:hypothetical protein